jgi:predicted Zn-dependent protease
MRIRSLLVPAIFCCVVTRCSVNPATGRRELVLVSESQEIAMGRQYDQQVTAEMGVYPDTALGRYVEALGRKLAAVSERPQLDWSFRLVDDPAVNAFALPGGYIYVTRGLLAHMTSEAQLAGVLGHEIGHVTARHSVVQMTQQQLTQVGLAVGVALKPELARYAGAAQQALGLLFLKFSRDDESQADELGFRYVRRTNYDPREMAEMFRELSRVSAAAGARVPEWASTHPDPANREEKAVERAATLTPDELAAAVVNRDPYLRRLDDLMFGPNPREGFFRGTRFLHPDLGFEFTFPTGWTTANQKAAVLAANANQDVIIRISSAQATTPGEAAQQFFSEQGVTGTPAALTVNGLQASGGGFSAALQDGTVQGRVMFVAQSGLVLQVLGYGTAASWPGSEALVVEAMRTFRPLTDQTALSVQPWHITIVRLDRSMTPQEFAQRYPGPVSADELAIINQLDADGRFMNRNLAKRVVGQVIR